MGFCRLLLAFLLLSTLACAEPPPNDLSTLQRGISITGWFRFPANADPAALRAYLPDAAIAALRRAGFTFLRLPVQPDFLLPPRDAWPCWSRRRAGCNAPAWGW